MSPIGSFDKEAELVAYCGLYCRTCDYFTGKLVEAARQALEVIERHGELKIFAEETGAFDYEELLRGLRWIARELGPCVGACRGGGGWGDCPVRRCCIERGVRFCYECDEFPCAAIKQLRGCEERLREIRRIGLEAWIKRQLGLPVEGGEP